MSSADVDEGPLMLCLTKVLKQSPTRVGHLFGNVTLPRTVAVRDLAAGVIGALILFVVSLPVVGMSLQQVIMSTMLGAAAGVSTQKYSPMKGESLFKWMQLSATSRLGRVTHHGESVNVYIGICPVTRVAGGKTVIFPGAVDVPEGTVDDRGWRDPKAVSTAAPAPMRRINQSRQSMLIPAPPVDLPTVAAPPSWAHRRPNTDTTKGS